MQNNRQSAAAQEENDKNRQEPHDPVQAGKEAIEAGKLNERDKPAGQQREEEEKDAENWRNEG
jgi:hypothetical protein